MGQSVYADDVNCSIGGAGVVVEFYLNPNMQS